MVLVQTDRRKVLAEKDKILKLSLLTPKINKKNPPKKTFKTQNPNPKKTQKPYLKYPFLYLGFLGFEKKGGWLGLVFVP